MLVVGSLVAGSGWVIANVCPYKYEQEKSTRNQKAHKRKEKNEKREERENEKGLGERIRWRDSGLGRRVNPGPQVHRELMIVTFSALRSALLACFKSQEKPQGPGITFSSIGCYGETIEACFRGGVDTPGECFCAR
ncbi:hypothetical protein AB1N83_007008 [Pleurotus pulmonarius]